jgi:hypothetical protein
MEQLGFPPDDPRRSARFVAGRSGPRVRSGDVTVSALGFIGAVGTGALTVTAHTAA